MKKILIFIFTAIFCLLLLSCAKQVFPTGGEGDKVPPRVVSVYPENQSLKIRESTRIVINFSKWINPRSVESGIIISPQTEFSLRVRARTVEIKPKTPLKPNTTYHVSLLGDITDFSQNSLVETKTIIFSTGDFIDSSFVEGRMFFEKRDSLLPKVALFFEERVSLGDSVLLSGPDYITQADSLGFFRFGNISESEYRLVGFFDRRRVNRIVPGETVFIGKEKIVTVQNFYELFPATVDTVQKKLHSATAISPNIVLLRSAESFYDSLEIFSESDSKTVRIERIEEIEGSANFAIFLEDSLENQLYVLATKSRRVFVNDGDSIFYDTTKFNGTTLYDTVQIAKLDSLLLQDNEKSTDDINDGEESDLSDGDTTSVEVLAVALCPKLSWNFFGELPENPLWRIKGERETFYTNEKFIENIPEGQYTLSLIDDRNQNGKHDIGTLFPYLAGEKKITFPDTLIARERWEVEYDLTYPLPVHDLEDSDSDLDSDSGKSDL
jgi:hypothetical protein